MQRSSTVAKQKRLAVLHVHYFVNFIEVWTAVRHFNQKFVFGWLYEVILRGQSQTITFTYVDVFLEGGTIVIP